jgi:hypothetical protein
MNALRILVGLMMIVLGRQLFWLFVAGTGFVTTLEIVGQLAVAWPDWMMVIVALLVGVVGALLAIFLQEIAVGVGGFFAGGYIVMALLRLFEVQVPVLVWALPLIGAVVGVILALLTFDWALIVLSSLSGASILAQAVNLNRPLTLAVFVGAFILGVVIQTRMMRRRQPLAAGVSAAQGDKEDSDVYPIT